MTDIFYPIHLGIRIQSLSDNISYKFMLVANIRHKDVVVNSIHKYKHEVESEGHLSSDKVDEVIAELFASWQ